MSEVTVAFSLEECFEQYFVNEVGSIATHTTATEREIIVEVLDTQHRTYNRSK